VVGADFEIQHKALALGSGFTGPAISGLMTVPGGYYIAYANCDIYYSIATGAHEVHGLIRAEYNVTASETTSSGGSVKQYIGLPTSDEMNVPGVPGARMNTFQRGAIYWSPVPGLGAHVVYGAIGAEYDATAAETTSSGGSVKQYIGLPTSDEMNVPGVPGASMNIFQRGAIYWSPVAGLGAHVVYGAIGAEYDATAAETTSSGGSVKQYIGLPTSDETNVPGVPGARMNTFQGGAIYWSPVPGWGAHVVYGAIGDLYNSMGGPTSYLGLPGSDEYYGWGIYRRQDFVDGWIYWSHGDVAHAEESLR
jgi:uncharacterized protein with LGFP repeats